MFTDLSDRARAATFAVLVLLVCAAISFTLRDTGETAAVVAMFAPALTVLLMQLVVTRDGWRREGWSHLGLRPAAFRWWPVAVALPVAILLASEAVVALTGLTDPLLAGLPSPVDLVMGSVIVFGFVFFEEIGWRGYLLPVVQRDGRPFAAARVGFVHGLFHLPIVFLVPGAYLTEGNRWIVVPMFLVVLTTAGVLYGWLRDRSGSVWPAVVTHTAFNMALGVVADAMPTGSPDTVALVGRETGIATVGALVIAAVWLTVVRRDEPAAGDADVIVGQAWDRDGTVVR